jgi:signal transduction histidine kinase/DNA-binding response OmpR family regulator/ligand-binding sensor domain-containing protein
MIRPGLFCLLVMLCFTLRLEAQQKLLPVFYFNRLSAADGLPTNTVRAPILRDSKGFVWIGTASGLARYDGYEVKTYRYSPDDSTSLPTTTIIRVMEDSKHRIWVCTWNEGISLFDAEHDCFVNFRHRPGDSSWIQARTVGSMVEDSSGTLWFGTGGTGILRVKLASSSGGAGGISFKSFSLGTPHNIATDLFMRTDGKVLVASDRGLLVFDCVTGAISRPDFHGSAAREIDSVFVIRVRRDPAGDFWAIADRTLFKVNARDGTVVAFRHRKDDSLSVSDLMIMDLAIDRRGNVWIANERGLELVDPSSGRRIPFLSGMPPPPDANVHLSIDPTGTLWVSNSNGGVYWLSEKSRRFPRYGIPAKGLAPRPFESIEVAGKDTVWLTSQGTLYKIALTTGAILKTIGLLGSGWADNVEPNKQVSYLAPAGTFWYALWGNGLFSVDLTSGSITKFRYPNPDMVQAAIRSITPGSGDMLWIAATLDGLWKFDPNSGKFSAGSRTRFNRANGAMRDQRGKIWVSTIFDGLFVVDPVNDSVQHFIHDPSDPHSLSNDKTNDTYEDPLGRIWCGAISTLNLWNPDSRTFTHYINPGAVEASGMNTIGADRNGRLWVSYFPHRADMLAVFDPSTDRFVNFDPSDGVAGSATDLYNVSDGRLLICGGGGVNLFEPDSVLASRRPVPALVFTDVKINDRPIAAGTQDGAPRVLELSHDQNSIEIGFAALDIDAPKLVGYRYMLEGIDDGWNSPGNRRYVRYPSLRPGIYEFRVRASSLREEWPDQEIALAITILPPWWQSRWAYGIYALFLIGLLSAAYRLRVNQIRLQQRVEMEHFQAERLTEVDRLKSRFFLNISHEFRTPLTLILGPAEQGLAATNSNSKDEKFRTINENAKRLLGLVNQLLDFSRLESGAMRLSVARGDLVPFIRRLVLSFESWAERKKIDLTFRSDCESLSGLFDGEKLEKVVNNLVSNAMKFAEEGGAVNVSVTEFRYQISDIQIQNSVTMSVTDTGPGIAPEHLAHIFDRFYRVDETHATEGTGIGLALTKELVELHHGTIIVESAPGKGSVFTVTIPIDESSFRSDEIAEDLPAEEQLERPDAHSPEKKSVSVVAPGPTAGKPTILVVEDNPDLRQYIREYFSAEYVVEQAENGRVGCERAREIVPDLVISDIMMPEMDGLELCSALKHDLRTSHVPVLLLTARAGTDSKVEGLDIGADDYMTKPFEMKELLARVRNMIEQRRILRAKFSAAAVLRPGDVAVSSMDDELLKKVMRVIENRMGQEKLEAEDIAREVALSRRHLDRKLLGLTNLSTAELVRYVRLQRANELLEKRAGTVAEIAYQVGFGNPSYFASCFRERFGCLPSEIRGQNS